MKDWKKNIGMANTSTSSKRWRKREKEESWSRRRLQPSEKKQGNSLWICYPKVGDGVLECSSAMVSTRELGSM